MLKLVLKSAHYAWVIPVNIWLQVSIYTVLQHYFFGLSGILEATKKANSLPQLPSQLQAIFLPRWPASAGQNNTNTSPCLNMELGELWQLQMVVFPEAFSHQVTVFLLWPTPLLFWHQANGPTQENDPTEPWTNKQNKSSIRQSSNHMALQMNAFTKAWPGTLTGSDKIEGVVGISRCRRGKTDAAAAVHCRQLPLASGIHNSWLLKTEHSNLKLGLWIFWRNPHWTRRRKCKQMEPAVVNRSVHTRHKQHQRFSRPVWIEPSWLSSLPSLFSKTVPDPPCPKTKVPNATGAAHLLYI